MPTLAIDYYKFPYGMDDRTASYAIRATFPKGIFHRRQTMSVGWIHRAMMYARTKCASEDVNECIKWAYEIHKKKK